MDKLQNTHGGKRTPGPGKTLGRSRREEPKAKPIWCGQISEEQRALIMEKLTPEERLEALLTAAAKKK
jgi:hypothetical protein